MCIALVAGGLLLPTAAGADGGPKPRILSVSYQASHEFEKGGRRPAVVVRARDRDGRIVSVAVKGRRIAVATRAGCGRANSPRGALHRYFLPARRLAQGPHELDARAESSSCDAAERTQRITRRMTVRVPDRAPTYEPPEAPTSPEAKAAAAPPPAWLAARAGSTWLKYGSYCWAGSCNEGLGPKGYDVLPPTVTVRRGEEVRIHFGFTPKRVRLSAGAKEQRLRPRRVVRWRVARSSKWFAVRAERRGGGGANYLALLRVKPERRKSGNADCPTGIGSGERATLAPDKLLGMPQTAATDLAACYAITVRAVRIDGKGQSITRDLRVDRVNVSLQDGRVASIDGIY